MDVIDAWSRWHQQPLTLPRKPTTEHKPLEEISRTPWLGLVVNTVAQCMYVDNYISAVDAGAAPEPGPDGVLEIAEIDGPWRTWQANRFDARQIAVHRATLTYGQSYVTVLPGEFGGRPTSVMRGVSPSKMFALSGTRDCYPSSWIMSAFITSGAMSLPLKLTCSK
ncbi:phage portal protein [Pseudonocardia halophobica]|uniref:phage portal protein n=1 Tax=Pseudonocardia halophobica TaxID=29401 RepID=UPI003D8FBBDF